MDLDEARGRIDAVRDFWQPTPGWLNTASYGLPPAPAWDELQRALADWRGGSTPWEAWDEATTRARETFARLVGVDAEDVAVGAQVSQLIGPIAAGVPAGTHVIVPEVEFASNMFPWLVQEARGVRVTPVPLEGFEEALDGAQVAAFSLVQSASGEIADYVAITGKARERGVLTVVDATQACGWLPFDAARADVVVVGAYKWLMAMRGSAFAYLSPDVQDRFEPLLAGWYAGEDVHTSYYGPPLRLAKNARRFDISPAWHPWISTAPALAVVEQIGIEAIHAYDLALANRFRVGLGLPQGDSAIVTTDVPGAEERLAAAGIRAAVRAGRLRASFHLYTTEQDVDLAVTALTA